MLNIEDDFKKTTDFFNSCDTTSTLENLHYVLNQIQGIFKAFKEFLSFLEQHK
jgi:hypothetical protein